MTGNGYNTELCRMATGPNSFSNVTLTTKWKLLFLNICECSSSRFKTSDWLSLPLTVCSPAHLYLVPVVVVIEPSNQFLNVFLHRTAGTLIMGMNQWNLLARHLLPQGLQIVSGCLTAWNWIQNVPETFARFRPVSLSALAEVHKLLKFSVAFLVFKPLRCLHSHSRLIWDLSVMIPTTPFQARSINSPLL